MTNTPERIWWNPAGHWSSHDDSAMRSSPSHEYIRADLARPAPTLADAMALPEVQALVEALQTIKIGTTPEADPDTGDLVEGWMGVDEMQEIALAALAPFTAAKEPKA